MLVTAATDADDRLRASAPGRRGRPKEPRPTSPAPTRSGSPPAPRPSQPTASGSHGRSTRSPSRCRPSPRRRTASGPVGRTSPTGVTVTTSDDGRRSRTRSPRSASPPSRCSTRSRPRHRSDRPRSWRRSPHRTGRATPARPVAVAVRRTPIGCGRSPRSLGHGTATSSKPRAGSGSPGRRSPRTARGRRSTVRRSSAGSSGTCRRTQPTPTGSSASRRRSSVLAPGIDCPTPSWTSRQPRPSRHRSGNSSPAACPRLQPRASGPARSHARQRARPRRAARVRPVDAREPRGHPVLGARHREPDRPGSAVAAEEPRSGREGRTAEHQEFAAEGPVPHRLDGRRSAARRRVDRRSGHRGERHVGGAGDGVQFRHDDRVDRSVAESPRRTQEASAVPPGVRSSPGSDTTPRRCRA